MIPNHGQHVKIIFKNSTQVEGLVETWSDTKVSLKSEDGKSVLLIMNLSEDVLAVKISLEEKTNPKTKLTNLEEEFEKTYERPSNDDLRIKDLAKLRIAMAEQEKKIIAEKMVEHSPNNFQKIKYANPFTKK